MNRTISVLGLALATTMLSSLTAGAQDLRVFVGGQQRPDVIRPLLDRYQESHPGVTVEIEVGGATSELQQQYLSTVLTSGDSTIDVFLIDVVRPAQYAAAGWAEPLDAYLGGDKETLLAEYLPAYAEANQVDGKLIGLPAFADAMFLYYRTDLLEKYGFEPPRTWEEMTTQAKAILEGEGNPNLQGFSFQGAAIEGANCTFLIPYWGQGASLTNEAGEVAIDEASAMKAFDFLTGLMDQGVAKPNIAEVGTDVTRQEFQAGNVVFAQLWGYGWNLFQGADSQVAAKVGVVPLPAFEGGESVTCIGGWQWAVSAFSEHKAEAAELVRFLSGPEGSKHLAVNASNIPARPATYEDAEVLEKNPWFADALPVVMTARSRPVSPRYPEVSETIRTNVNAVVARTKSPADAIAEMQARLSRVLR